NRMCPTTPPQVAESRVRRTPTPPDEESAADLEPVDAEPRLPPQSPCSAASGRGVDPQQGFGSCEQRHPLAPDDGGEKNDEEGPTAPPQARESMAGLPTLPDGGGNVDHEPAGASPPMQPPASRDQAKQVSLQQNIGRRRRRQRCDTDDKEDCSPIVGSDAERGKDEDVVQPPRGKRRKVNTVTKKQARLRTNSPSQPAQQGPKRRQSQRRVSNPQSSGASALGEETPEAAFASFEEWPLEAVLKRVWVDGAATFQVEFTWNPCTIHGRHGRAPESPRRRSPAGRTSSAARALPSRVASTTQKVQGDEYFNVEEILEWRQGEKGLEYLVKWAGYGKKYNSWEPAAHFEQCLEILEQFHLEEGLPPP
ncbi:hypothetical protein C8A05DRAFT_19809, partial [Staphylotrichum tortipilum]